MTDDLHELASAYLDGRADADERARVEASAELLAEVQRMRVVRAVVADLEPPPISVREEHLAAALGAWDRLPEGERTGVRRDATPTGADATAAAAAAAVTRTERRRSRSAAWWGAAAAAGLVVVGAGVVLSRLGDPGGDEVAEPAATTVVADEPSAVVEDAASEPERAAVPAADEAFGDGDGAGDAAVLAAEDLEATEEAAAEDVAAAAGEATLGSEVTSAEGTALEAASADPDPRGPPPDGDVSSLPLLTDAADLADFAAPALAATESPTDVTTPFPTCAQLGVDVVVGPATYAGIGPVVVGVDTDRQVAIAYLESCAPVQTVDIP
jgi:hypothetical protein